MKPSRMELLKRVYEEELKTDDVVCISLIGVNNPRALIEDSNQLIEEDYLTSPYKATRQLNLKLTDKGWDYVKNNFQSRDGVMSVSGDNNIIINGNSNTVKNKLFFLSHIAGKTNFDRVKDKFLWLSDAGVVHPVYNITEPKAPLKINEKRNLFKLFLSDTGLLTSYYSDSVRLGILSNDSSFNNGGLYENVVAQELCANGYSDLWYYNNKVLGELDFVIEQDNNVLPIEVKSGKNYFLHSALNNVLSVNDYHINEAIVLNNGNLRVDGKIIYMPIYMLIFFKRNPSGEIKYHLDLDGI